MVFYRTSVARWRTAFQPDPLKIRIIQEVGPTTHKHVEGTVEHTCNWRVRTVFTSSDTQYLDIIHDQLDIKLYTDAFWFPQLPIG
jgi:hypothetical protein